MDNAQMIDITGTKFDRLTAIAPTGEKRWGVYVWRCACECGGETSVAVNTLRSGLVRSCGCLKKESARSRVDFHGMRGTSTYASWDAMIQRCTNPKNISFKNYGAIGIAVCDRWRSFQFFLEDMGCRPAGSTLDRKKSHLGYSKENCQWSDPVTQNRNKRSRTTTKNEADTIRALYLMGYPPKAIRNELGLTKGQVDGVIYSGQVWQADDHYTEES